MPAVLQDVCCIMKSRNQSKHVYFSIFQRNVYFFYCHNVEAYIFYIFILIIIRRTKRCLKWCSLLANMSVRVQFLLMPLHLISVHWYQDKHLVEHSAFPFVQNRQNKGLETMEPPWSIKISNKLECGLLLSLTKVFNQMWKLTVKTCRWCTAN